MSLECISAAGVRGKRGLAQIKGLALFFYGYAQSRRILKRFQPDMILGVGGYASAPLCLAARGMQISYSIHEQNAIPGLTNRWLAHFARHVFISLEESGTFFPKEKIMLTGNPLRKAILDQVEGEQNRFFSDSDKGESPVGQGDVNLLVFGGSQGSSSINLAVIAALAHLTGIRERLTVTHQTGQNDRSEVENEYKRLGFRATVLPFIDDMSAAYRQADLILCRAGATTIAEVTACGKPCLFIPFPHAVDDHQRKNAEALLKKEACFMLLERELTGERLAKELLDLLADPARLKVVGQNARSLARLDAARIIVNEMVAVRKEAKGT
jgi:UDP-N-acetylglucosamine--N-acetylmuramyl-(pentapeptide) pyrophosphoryl-undecaprenol N-acetylglucosamine transferase